MRQWTHCISVPCSPRMSISPNRGLWGAWYLIRYMSSRGRATLEQIGRDKAGAKVNVGQRVPAQCAPCGLSHWHSSCWPDFPCPEVTHRPKRFGVLKSGSQAVSLTRGGEATGPRRLCGQGEVSSNFLVSSMQVATRGAAVHGLRARRTTTVGPNPRTSKGLTHLPSAVRHLPEAPYEKGYEPC